MKKIMILAVVTLSFVACTTGGQSSHSPFIVALADGLRADTGITEFRHDVFADGGVEWFAFIVEGKGWVMANGNPPKAVREELWPIVDKVVPEDEHLVVRTYWLGIDRAWVETPDGQAGFYRVSIVEGEYPKAIETLEKASKK